MKGFSDRCCWLSFQSCAQKGQVKKEIWLFVRKTRVYISHIHCFEMDLLMSEGDTKPKVLLRFQKEEEGHNYSAEIGLFVFA